MRERIKMTPPKAKSTIYIGSMHYDVREDYEHLSNTIANFEPDEHILIIDEYGVNMSVRVGAIDVIRELP